MIKCFFVDIKSIKSQIPKSKFNKSEIEKIADLILITDGLLRPLILKQTGVEQYTVVEGDLAYYAAVRAKEKDLHKAEMVNAFVIPDDHQQSAIDQIALLSGTKPTTVPISPNINQSIADLDTNLFEQLSVHLTAIVSQQLQPLQQQLNTVITELASHKPILASLSQQPVDLNIDAKIEVSTNQTSTDAGTTKNPRKKTNSKITQKQIELKPFNSPDVVATDRSPQSRIEEPTIPASTKKLITSEKTKPATPKNTSKTQKSPISTATKKSTTTEKTKPATTPTNSKIKSDPFASIDPDQLVKTLNLINTLNLNELTLKMSKSGIGSTAGNLATNIVAIRDTQPEQKFDTWEEIVLAKISGLTLTMAIKVIEKLK
jgi:hypothetical protein